MRTSRRGVASAVGLLVTLSLPNLAWAEPPKTAENRIAAQVLFDQGLELSKAGKYPEACAKLAASYELDSEAMGTKFYLAECYEHIGKLASAWNLYLDVAHDSHKSGEKDREKFVTERASALRPRLPDIAVNVPDALKSLKGLVVKRDAVTLTEGQWGTPIPVDFGKHTVTVTASSKQTWTGKVEVKQDSEHAQVDVPPLEDERATTPEAPIEPPPSRGGGTRRLTGYVMGAAGVVGLGVGFGLGGAAMSKNSDANNGHCDANNVCDKVGADARHSAIGLASGSTALVIASSIALASGVVLVLTAPSRTEPTSDAATKDASVRFAPRLGLGLGTISLQGAF